MHVNLHLFDVELYRKDIEPALDAYVTDGDPSGALVLLNKVASSDMRLAESELEWDVMKLSLVVVRRVLARESSYSSESGFSETTAPMSKSDRQEFAELHLAGVIVAPLCVPWNRLGKSQPFVYFGSDAIRKNLGARGDWLAEVAESERHLKGPDIKYPIGRSGRILLRDELNLVKAALEPGHDSVKDSGYAAHLRLLVAECLKHDRFALLYSLMP